MKTSLLYKTVHCIVMATTSILLCASAIPTRTAECNDMSRKILWVVDGVALHDSIFTYSIDRMRSDSAMFYAAQSLSYVYPSDIESICVMDSIEAVDYGFVNCSGVVKIQTSFRESLLIVVNGIPYKSRIKMTAGEMLGTLDCISQFLVSEIPDLQDYDVKSVDIIKDLGVTCHKQRTPFVVITTGLRYYRVDDLAGVYFAKHGKQNYTLHLNNDSTYVFTQRRLDKRAIAPEIRNAGTWSISKGRIVLKSGNNSEDLLSSGYMTLDGVVLDVKNRDKLTMPKQAWHNRKNLTLKRQRK
ncbi:MAG: copper resistance protein NlpE [Muribaculaceae bacterium]|nr:copper resistance protein NlpE [Muribaculaceae bacterium]